MFNIGDKVYCDNGKYAGQEGTIKGVLLFNKIAIVKSKEEYHLIETANLVKNNKARPAAPVKKTIKKDQIVNLGVTGAFGEFDL